MRSRLSFDDFLIRENRVSREVLNRAKDRKSYGKTGKPARVLVDMGILSPEDLFLNVLQYMNATGSPPGQLMEWISPEGVEALVERYGADRYN